MNEWIKITFNFHIEKKNHSQWTSTLYVEFAAGGIPLSAMHWYAPMWTRFTFVMFSVWPGIEDAADKIHVNISCAECKFRFIFNSQNMYRTHQTVFVILSLITAALRTHNPNMKYDSKFKWQAIFVSECSQQ